MLNAEFKQYDLNKYLVFKGSFRIKTNIIFKIWIQHSKVQKKKAPLV